MIELNKDASRDIPQIRIRLLTATALRCTSSWADFGQREIRDPFSRLYWLEDGEARINLHQKQMVLHPGRLYVIPAYVSSRYFCPDSMYLYYAHFTADIFGGMEVFSFFDWPLEVACPDMKQVGELWERLLKLKNEPSLRSRLESDAVLRLLLSRFVVDSVRNHSPGEDRRFRKVLRYIEEHYTEHLSLEEMAGLVHLHPTYFSNQFTRIFGISPIQYINRRRVQEAEQVLRFSDLTVGEIAYRLGYSDPFHFSRQFKKTTGLSPSGYRNAPRLEA